MSSGLIEIKNCEVCGSFKLDSVLNLGIHPMCDDLVPVNSDRVCSEYPIEIMFCEICKTAHQKYQVPKKELFPDSYHYRSRFTADVLNGMQSLVVACESHTGSLSGKKILDIGCNDGSLLDFFKQKGAVTLGIEPTGAFSDAKAKGHIVYNEFLSEQVANLIVEKYGNPDFITFTNVFAHIENLKEVLSAVKNLMDNHTIIVIENHYLGAVLDGTQFDTFYHEHPRTYSYTSFLYMAKSLGVKLLEVEFPSRYGGNIRVFLGNSNNFISENQSLNIELIEKEKYFSQHFNVMREKIGSWKLEMRSLIENLVKTKGKLRAKAFPGRAAILIKMLGLDENLISEVYEKPGSLKIGHYLPGTRIPIKSDDDLFALHDKSLPLLNLAWHIPKEIHGYLSKNGYSGPIIDIIQSEKLKG